MVRGFPALTHHAFYVALRDRGLLEKVRFNLSDACAQSRCLGELLDGSPAQAALSELRLTYSDPLGAVALKQLICQMNGYGSVEDTVLFSGAQEALFACMANLLGPGDEVVQFSPCYPPLMATPECFGAISVVVPLQRKDHWQLDLDRLQDSVTDRTKLIIINQPHNPTGSVLSSDQIQQLHQWVQARGITLMTDEVAYRSDYQGLGLTSLYDGSPHVISIGVASKSLGLGGVRIGWANISDPVLREAVLNTRSYLSICVSKTDEYLLTQALQQADTLLAKNNQILRDNHQAMASMVEQMPELFDWVPPQAGILSLLGLPRVASMDDFVYQLIEQTGMMLLPGHCFGLSGPYVRLGLGKSGVKDQLPALASFVEDYGQDG